MKERSEALRDFQAKFRLRVESKTAKFSARAIVLVKGKYFARFETFGPMGQTAALFVSNETGPALLIPSERAIFKAREAEALIQHFLGVPLPFDAFRHVLTATVPGDDAIGNYKLNPLAEGPDIKEIQVLGEGFEAKAIYEPPVSLTGKDGLRKIRLLSSEWTIEVNIEELEPARTFQPSVFYLPSLSDIKIVDLDKLK